MSQELVPISPNLSICLGTYTLGNWVIGHGSSALGHGSLALGHGSLGLGHGGCALGHRIMALGPGSFNVDLILNCKIRVITCPGELHSFFFIRTKFIRTFSLRFHTILRTF